jgi:hypothetical protein
MDPRRFIARKRARWQARSRVSRPMAGGRPETGLGDAAMSPIEVLGSSRDERGVVCGPYDYRYMIDAGYATERTVIRP